MLPTEVDVQHAPVQLGVDTNLRYTPLVYPVSGAMVYPETPNTVTGVTMYEEDAGSNAAPSPVPGVLLVEMTGPAVPPGVYMYPLAT